MAEAWILLVLFAKKKKPYGWIIFFQVPQFFSVLSLNQLKVGLVLVFLPSIKHEELMKWYQSGVTRARIRVIEVNFGEILIKGKNI